MGLLLRVMLHFLLLLWLWPVASLAPACSTLYPPQSLMVQIALFSIDGKRRSVVNRVLIFASTKN
jgi:hypothetical protein